MATIRSLLDRIGKLEHQRSRHGEFRVVEEYSAETEFWAECHFALVRNGQVVVRFPRRLTIDEWTARYSSTP